MLFLKPEIYYKEILRNHPNSYLAEDERQVIIGIDCEYLDANKMSYDEFKLAFEKAKFSPKTKAKFAGFFGVTSYEIVHKFEYIGELKEPPYSFPKFFYADAKAYLHYDKMSKIYSFFSENFEIFKSLENLEEKEIQSNKNASYKILSDLEKERIHFRKMIEKAKEYIKSGDVFQVVLAEILEISTNLSSFDFYKELKKNNPSPYMFHFPTPYGDVVGSSPELVMQIKDDEIFVAPIAGTRKRGANANEDEALKKELLSDEKELAEHKMLIDLARNDIGKFAKIGSVAVRKPMQIVMYESVMHILSEVYGKKREDASVFEVFSVVFPAGTLSGSPKIRAMQVINELEISGRGIYGGGIGFWHFNGDMQMAILIRSAIFVPNLDENFASNLVYIGAGAGIVHDSLESGEYSEICNKRESCVKVIRKLCEEVK